MPLEGRSGPRGSIAAHFTAPNSCTPTRMGLLSFNSFIFSFPCSRAAFPQVPRVKLSVLDSRKKKGRKKVKHKHKKTKQKTPTTNYIPSGNTQSTTYTTSLLAPLFIAQLKHLFPDGTTQSTGVAVSRSKRSCESPAATCAWPLGPTRRGGCGSLWAVTV